MLQGKEQLIAKSSTAEGELFGRYRLRGVLGQGGMGRLYVAEQLGIEGFSKIVALKQILPHLADSPQFRDMFLNEARVAARLEHPNIVATYELGEVAGQYFISMEYLCGEDLAAILNRCQKGSLMPLDIAAALAQQSANGLHYAHEMQDSGGRPVELVHRDVSPLNIFVTYYGMVKLLDFGIVKRAGETSETVPGVFKGKYAYCAPEQIEGRSIDRRTDLFCLGIVLWECLTGRRLFCRSTDVRTIEAARGDRILPPSAHRKEVPPELDDIVMRCLARDPEDRFQSCHVLSEALDQFLLQRNHRPTSKSMGLWLESLFGLERAMLKRSIAQGSEVETALAWLPAVSGIESVTADAGISGKSRSIRQPRVIWSKELFGESAVEAQGRTRTPSPVPLHLQPRRSEARGAGEDGRKIDGSGSFRDGIFEGGDEEMDQRRSSTRIDTVALGARPAPTSAGRRQPQGWRTAAIAFCAVAATLVAAIVTRSRVSAPAPEAAAAPALGGVDVRSEPEGAHVFVAGDPIGLTTPALLSGLRAGRTIELRLEKAGYQPVSRPIEIAAGAPRVQTFRLVEAAGTIVVDDLPPGSSVYVDGVLVEGTRPISLPLGPHRLRVEASAELILSRDVDVHPGEQRIRVEAPGPTPARAKPSARPKGRRGG